ncbi:prenyltransferase and squalene oxidase repeat domain containing protein [Nitzschia inconspicua]|uniref:Geranylgeranyl transferase type-2 subunit beta n=1 Tax=Nitzschia inconspicua TaxID=303405 RepID=A0A9K3PNI7_9STRA|nr:prenyltransferase and squalene oxidase repeat domain containing protein [Nitzschia inconspicua]
MDENAVVTLDIGGCTTTTTTTAPTSLFYHGRHVQYIEKLSVALNSTKSYEGAVTEHLRMSGIYWTYAALSLLVSPEQADSILGVHCCSRPSNDEKTDQDYRPSIVEWVYRCFDERSGGFGGNIGHDGHLLYTLSAVQILAMANTEISQEKREAVIQFVVSLQQQDGSFSGDQWGEIDTRFTYCALCTLSLLKALDRVDVSQAVEYIASCQNLDGGFGSMKGAESHAGQVFCCVGALSIAKSLHKINHPDLLGWWLAERQVDSGGLNGRPEKQADVCYSWWILSVMTIIGRVDWISKDKLASFIAKAQDPEDGGIADRPEDMPDVFHTFFGIAGLSLLGKLPDSFRKIDPVYALPVDVVVRCGLSSQILAVKDSE